MAESIVEAGEVSGRIKEILCQPCLNKDNQTTKVAEKFCSSCNEFQCLDCSNVHYTHAFLRNHKLVNANEAKTKQGSFDMKGLDQCDKHRKVLKFFCEDDNQLCCSTCAIVEHRKCHSVVEILKVAERSTYGSSTLNAKLEEVRQKANNIVDSIVSSKEKLDEDAKEIPVNIRRMRDEVMKMFDELEISVVKDVELFQKETLEKLTIRQSQNEKYLTDITTCLETIDNVYQNGSLVQQFIVEQKMKNDVNVLHTNVNTECQSLETVTVTFEFDETLKLPPLSVTDYVPGQLTLSFCLSEVANTIVPVNKTMILTPVNSIDIKQEKDDVREPFYTGIDFLPDGRLVAVDNKIMKFLVYNEKLEKVASYQLLHKPQSVVVVSEEEVAITSGLKLNILRVNKSNDLTSDITIKVTTKYSSIFIKDDKHFVGGTINHSTPVRIISSTGEEKDFNINFPNKSYPVRTSACTYIRNSDKVVLTDRPEHTICIYDVKTNTRVVVKDDQIKDPCGVSIGPYDTILVCSNGTNSIVQISQTGQILSSYKIDMEYPYRACVSRDKSFLAITNSCTDYQAMLKNPRRVFNADESGFPLAVKSGRVIAPLGARHVYQVVTNTKTQITVMVSFNAFGKDVPPMILFPGERLRNVGLSGFPEATYAKPLMVGWTQKHLSNF
ncbi:uncharacterized protein LOC132724685 [Ruditapes philippinarum]|uniref:uncharacterized protein LOC132724685 n=1 Tax=Ruditapes philippinarum TaxID=129788 RepID=UPI00295AD590|nr:uncharacterized protein LOC132724685 [Ruditapes philippinarum]